MINIVSFLNIGKFMHISVAINYNNKRFEPFFGGALLFGNTFKMKYLQRILDHF